jgi:hypothetical protein
MANSSDLRKHLESEIYPDLATMMEGYAHAAVEMARSQFGLKLDYTSESVDSLDEILVLVCESPELDMEFEVRLWGSYLGEVLRRRYSGSWEMAPYPGGPNAAPSVEVRGTRMFPLMKVFRRLNEGSESDLKSFFSTVTERLGSPSWVN